MTATSPSSSSPNTNVDGICRHGRNSSKKPCAIGSSTASKVRATGRPIHRPSRPSRVSPTPSAKMPNSWKSPDSISTAPILISPNWSKIWSPKGPCLFFRFSATRNPASASAPTGRAPGNSSAAKMPEKKSRLIREGRLSLRRLLASPRQARCPQRTLACLLAPGPRCGQVPRHRLGRLRPRPAGHRTRQLLLRYAQ